jgi:uncharacterized membrane protein
MERYNIIDNLRGIAFIFMLFQHLFYFYDVSNDYQTNYSNNSIVDTFGSIARTMFILLAGYSVYMVYKKDPNNHIKKRIKKSTEILLHGLFITFITYVLYPKYFVRFGILHFLALGTLLISFIASNKILPIIFLIIGLSFNYPKINSFFDLITGASIQYSMMDWFPLNSSLPIMLCGLIIGQHLDISSLNFLQGESILTYLGKNSLNLYTLHVTVLLIVYKILKIIKN